MTCHVESALQNIRQACVRDRCISYLQVGSPNLDAFLNKHVNLLKADYALSADGGQLRCAPQ